jgi:hypothetical protein
MTYPWSGSADLDHVVDALSNGIRSEVEIAQTARLPLDRVRVALKCLVARSCVTGSPQTPGSRFRLTDNGNDMVKIANAAERKARS